MTEQTQHGLAGIVLAGGRSRRMGQDKASLEWEGRPMVKTVVDVVAQRCAPVKVAAPEGSQAYQELNDDPDLTWITDEEVGKGPLAGIVAALRAAKDVDASAVFVCATDMPLMSPALVDELLHALTSAPDVVIVHEGGRDHPLAGIYRTRALPALQAQLDSGDVLMTSALESVVTHRVGVSDPSWLTNVDAPEDLHRLRA
ncbi:MAG: molybdenum cofactor guanylyltransferase [Gordonia sp. (in: high G+C Gram-positive bacteria)]|uniref:molybdenum cofactor guanylyltransferase n=1 Tax=Gordonia sp. (in: high G+C Gram-positive bacteria) TaxID=84139 RepID=UPI0039E72318